jgi:hypothetical protein
MFIAGFQWIHERSVFGFSPCDWRNVPTFLIPLKLQGPPFTIRESEKVSGGNLADNDFFFKVVIADRKPSPLLEHTMDLL